MEQERVDLQNKIDNFLKSIETEFPEIARRMNVSKSESIPGMRKLIHTKFCLKTVFSVGLNLSKAIRTEESGYLKNDDVEKLIAIIGERISLHSEGENTVDLESLKKNLELNIKGAQLWIRSNEIENEFKMLLSDESLAGMDVIFAISSAFLEMLNGKTPEEAKIPAELKTKAEALIMIKKLSDDIDRCVVEKAEFIEESKGYDSVRDIKYLNLMEDILKRRMEEYNEGSCNYSESESEKKNVENILVRLGKIIRIVKKEQEWMDIANRCGMYFSIMGSNDMVELLGRGVMMQRSGIPYAQ